MSDRILLGAVAATLEANGFFPSAVDAPGKSGFRYADSEAAIALIQDGSSGYGDHKQRRVCALIVGTRNAKARTDILKVLSRFKLDGAPCRVASDGSLAFVLRHTNDYGTVHTRESERSPGESEPAVLLVGEERPTREYPPPNVLRVSGVWKDGRDLLTVKREELPEIDDEDALFSAIHAVVNPRYTADEKVTERAGWGKKLPEPTPSGMVSSPNESRQRQRPNMESRHELPTPRYGRPSARSSG